MENLRFDEEQSRFLWEGPEYSEICDVQYEVLFENEMTAALNTIYDEFYQISVYPCSTNKISITTIIGFDGSRSDTVSETFNGPVKSNNVI